MKISNPSNHSTPQFLNLCNNFSPFQQVWEVSGLKGRFSTFDHNLTNMIDNNTLVAKFDASGAVHDGLVG
jgi:hypothetical protein